jgi:chaperone modulatory protein CbpM
MMRIERVVALFPDLDAAELAAWIAHRWVQPEPAEGESWIFHEIDVARVYLIYDLRHELDIAEEMMPLVLSLLDQVYELRRTLKAMTRALETQPPEVKDAVLAILKQGDGKS